MRYEDWQKRVIDEKIELDKKISKLSIFVETEVFKNLEMTDKKLLEDQLFHMSEYSYCLWERIKRFEK